MLGDAPALVRLHGSAQRNPHARCAFRTSHCVHLQTFLSIQTVDPLGIYLPPLAPQQNGEHESHHSVASRFVESLISQALLVHVIRTNKFPFSLIQAAWILLRHPLPQNSCVATEVRSASSNHPS